MELDRIAQILLPLVVNGRCWTETHIYHAGSGDSKVAVGFRIRPPEGLCPELYASLLLLLLLSATRQLRKLKTDLKVKQMEPFSKRFGMIVTKKCLWSLAKRLTVLKKVTFIP